ncbi:PREDICTED: uncharacterized protein K02A2.6-like [Priapulus caudatus]|uniref:RNA-directed DNA polymerase n=1 Tax=Priapulus caudatus TaxID=37621 RepID=A0ABM1FC57_PRICU|nr:PREDICTED: uncharacterized protein K02A2.6-like [Priapulus caudatus]
MPNPADSQDIPIDVAVDFIGTEIEGSLDIDLMFFGHSKREELQKETSADPVLRGPMATSDKWEAGCNSPNTTKRHPRTAPHRHMGIERTRRLARETVFWPGINNDIEHITKDCPACQELQTRQQKEPLQPHDVPTAPWTKLATDLFTLNRQDYLLITDYHSKYPVLYKLKDTSSAAVAGVMSGVFSLLGPPAEIVSDNGPQFSGRPFQEMCKKWSITHVTSSPHYPRSNGLAERMVRTVKSMLKKCSMTGQDAQIAMLHLRATPVDSHMKSPAELLLGRPIRTSLPGHHLADNASDTEHLLQRQNRMKETHDRHAGTELPPLHVGQQVRVLHPQEHTWIPAKISRQTKRLETAINAQQVPNIRRATRDHREEELRDAEAPQQLLIANKGV